MEKADFKNYRMLLWEVQQLKEQLAVLESSLYSPKGQRFTSTPTASGGKGSTMDGAVARHMELEKCYRDELAEKEAEQLAIERAIQSLDSVPERVIMREHYINGRKWSAVIREMQKKGYSERQVYRLHGYALLKLKEVQS